MNVRLAWLDMKRKGPIHALHPDPEHRTLCGVDVDVNRPWVRSYILHSSDEVSCRRCKKRVTAADPDRQSD